MKIVFLSNYFNRHQKPLCDEFSRLMNEDFKFIETMPLAQDQRPLGKDSSGSADYVVSMPDSPNLVGDLVSDADVVIAGSCPEAIVQNRIRSGKLTFRYSERPLKNGFEPLKFFPRYLKWHRDNPATSQTYLLCAGAYTASDYSRFGLFESKAYKWGYFPELREYVSTETLMAKKDGRRIVWCGRLVDFKHPEIAVEVARLLKSAGVDFRMDIIGNGPLEGGIRHKVQRYCLADRVSLVGPLDPSDVRDQMEGAGIFLFTSDGGEGWGAVLNEAMNSGCAIVARGEAGSVSYLVEHRHSGFIVHGGDSNECFWLVKALLDNPSLQEDMGRMACETIALQWNARIAACRFVQLAESILSGNPFPDLFPSGPCSRA